MSCSNPAHSRWVPSVDPVAAFSRNVKAAREAAGLTQEDAAHAAGLDVAQYRKVENGQTNASIRTVARVASALGLKDVAPLFKGVPATADTPRRKGR